jgi:hypothetical protein
LARTGGLGIAKSGYLPGVEGEAENNPSLAVILILNQLIGVLKNCHQSLKRPNSPAA